MKSEYLVGVKVVTIPNYAIGLLIDDLRISIADRESDRTYLETDQDNDVYIIWQEDRSGRPELFYSKLDSSGNVLIDDKRMTFGHPFQDPSSTGLTTDLLNQVQIVFADERVDNVELYYMEVDSTNGTKLIEDERITISQRYSISPSIAVNSSDSVHMAWGDNRSGNMEIWYIQ